MSKLDIGIDLGTTSIIVYMTNKGIVLREPSVVAYNQKTDRIEAVGEEAYNMLGKTPAYITAQKPIADGVISDYVITENMIAYFIKKVAKSFFFKPRVAICVPTCVSAVEAGAVVDSARAAGARKIFLIEEPIAAAIGAGMNISKPQGQMVVDIGGGTADVAVISLGGIVSSESVKAAGNKFDEAVAREVQSKSKIYIGERMAEKVKIRIGCVMPSEENLSIEIKGRNTLSGLPQSEVIDSLYIMDAMRLVAFEIIDTIKKVLEKTPPELSGDIKQYGMVLTGGGALIRGLPELILQETGVVARVADEPLDCVAVGTGRCFEFLEDLKDGFSQRTPMKR